MTPICREDNGKTGMTGKNSMTGKTGRPTRSAVLAFTEKYGSELSIDKAKHRVVRDIFRRGVLDEQLLEDNPTETLRSAQIKFLSWYMVSALFSQPT